MIESHVANDAGPRVTTYGVMRAQLNADQGIGRGAYDARTVWRGGAMTRSCTRDFTIDSDEPFALGGAASAPDPVELMLAALGASLTGAWLLAAEHQGVRLTALSIRLSAVIDLRGRAGHNPLIRPGVQRIDYWVEVESDAPAEALEAVRRAAEAEAPLLDNLRNPTRIGGQVARLRSTVAA